MVKLVTDVTFSDEVLKSTTPVIVDFWATWCGPCKMLAPIMEELSEEMSDKIKFTKMDVDENGITSSDLGIMSIPTVIIYKDGKIAGESVGYKSKQEMKQFILNNL